MVLFRDRTARLRARRRSDLGTWLGLIFWTTMIGTDHQVMARWVPYADIASIPGEDYSKVPTLT